jgi:Zn-finger nucleic acid-binding protein
MKCPKCFEELKSATIKETRAQIASCPSCRGLLIGDKDLIQLVPYKGSLWDFAKDGVTAAIKSCTCPKCSGQMFTGNIPKLGTQVELCQNCKAVWLDAGELQEVVQKCLAPEKPSSSEISASEITGQPSKGGVPPQFEAVRDPDEEFIYSSTPEYLPFIARGIPFLILGGLWGLFDLFVYKKFSVVQAQGKEFIGPFFLLHSMPFWLALLNIVRLHLIYPNTFYGFSSKRIFIRSGFWGTDFKIFDHDKLVNLEVNVNPVENLCGTGSIKISTGETFTDSKGRVSSVVNQFIGIKNPYDVFRQLKEVAFSTKTDIQYPNAYRPDENPGYKTKLKKIG